MGVTTMDESSNYSFNGDALKSSESMVQEDQFLGSPQVMKPRYLAAPEFVCRKPSHSSTANTHSNGAVSEQWESLQNGDCSQLTSTQPPRAIETENSPKYEVLLYSRNYC